MKNLVLAAVMMTGSMAFADITKTKIVGGAALKQQLIKDLMYEGKYEGELDEIGGSCTVEFEVDEDGNDQIVLKTEQGLKLYAPLYKNDEYTRKMDSDPDSSFSAEYTENEFGLIKISAVNVEDAYHYITIETASSKLTCGNWF